MPTDPTTEGYNQMHEEILRGVGSSNDSHARHSPSNFFFQCVALVKKNVESAVSKDACFIYLGLQ